MAVPSGVNREGYLGTILGPTTQLNLRSTLLQSMCGIETIIRIIRISIISNKLISGMDWRAVGRDFLSTYTLAAHYRHKLHVEIQYF